MVMMMMDIASTTTTTTTTTTTSNSSSSNSSAAPSSSSSSLSNPSPSLYDDAYSCPPTTLPSSSLLTHRRISPSWFSRLLHRLPHHKLSMEASDQGLLLHTTPSQTDADEQTDVEKAPKRELRFAAKIAAAMDADGLMGVKDSVLCADEVIPIGLKQAHACDKNLGSFYGGSTNRTPQQRAALKQTRRRRRWRICRRLRRTRVLFACMLQKVRKAFSTSSKRTLRVRDGFIK